MMWTVLLEAARRAGAAVLGWVADWAFTRPEERQRHAEEGPRR